MIKACPVFIRWISFFDQESTSYIIFLNNLFSNVLLNLLLSLSQLWTATRKWTLHFDLPFASLCLSDLGTIQRSHLYIEDALLAHELHFSDPLPILFGWHFESEGATYKWPYFSQPQLSAFLYCFPYPRFIGVEKMNSSGKTASWHLTRVLVAWWVEQWQRENWTETKEKAS